MWKTVKLGEVCEFENGDRGKNYPSKKHQVEKGIPFINAGDLSADGKITSDGMAYITNERFELLGAGKTEIDDILFCLRGSLGKCAINKSFDKGAIASSLVIMRANKSELIPEFLLYFLKSHLTAKLIQETAGGAAQPNLSAKVVSNYQLFIPPLAEQKRIVAKLDAAFAEIDRATEIATAKLENNRTLVESTLTSIFNTFPKGTQTTLGEYYDVRDGTHDSPKYVSEGYPLVTSKNLKTGSLDLSNVKYISEEDYIAINKRSAVHTGDVLMAMIGTIGNPIVINQEPSYSIKNVALFKTNKNQNPWFLKYYLEHPATKNQMQHDAKGTTQKFVGLGYLRKFPINAPTLETQNDIVEHIDTVFHEIETLEQTVKKTIEEYRALKLAILAQALQPSQSEAA